MDLIKIIREEIEGVFTDIHGKGYSSVEYTGVIIEGKEIERFESEISDRISELGIEIPENWERVDNYHMTITLGELGLGMKLSGAIGSRVELEVNSIGISDKAIAVGVSGMYSRNDIQHITLAFRDRPADSNEIIDWTPVKPFRVVGYIREVGRVNGWGKLRQK